MHSQSLSVLSEDITDATFENPIYHRVRGGIGQQIEISMRDDNLEICRFKGKLRKQIIFLHVCPDV